jgi:putative membrane protein
VEAKLAYWTMALADLALAVGFVVTGIRRVRRGNVAGHRRAMLAGGALVALFLVSYGFKVVFLGREDRSAWSASSLTVLYIHEMCIAAMVVAGAVAVSRARRFGDLASLAVSTPESRTRDRRVHRVAGRVAAAASLFALVTAAVVLAGMYGRAAF